jgi:hypothetical protein
MLNVATDISQSTISGIMSLKSGDTLNIKSAADMTIVMENAVSPSNPADELDALMKIESKNTLSQIVGTAWTSTTGTTWSHTSTGIATIVGSEIQMNP